VPTNSPRSWASVRKPRKREALITWGAKLGRPQTPKEYLRPYRAHFRNDVGLNNEQLDRVTLRRQHGERFADWMPMPRTLVTTELEHDLKAWCALRWLIIDDPTPSDDTRAAWDYVARYLERVPTHIEGRAAVARREKGLRQMRKKQSEGAKAREIRNSTIMAASRAGKTVKQIDGDRTIFPKQRLNAKRRVNRQKLIYRVISDNS
jgi:hypothetical protein